jgi:hypothetical protein
MGEEALDSPRTRGHTVRAVRRAAAPITAAPLQDVRPYRMDLADHGVGTTPQLFPERRATSPIFRATGRGADKTT